MSVISDGDFDFDPYPDDRDTQEVRCRHCHERGLFWIERYQQYQQWVLVDGEGQPHECPSRVATADDFND